jgi:hypothetical protein
VQRLRNYPQTYQQQKPCPCNSDAPHLFPPEYSLPKIAQNSHPVKGLAPAGSTSRWGQVFGSVPHLVKASAKDGGTNWQQVFGTLP